MPSPAPILSADKLISFGDSLKIDEFKRLFPKGMRLTPRNLEKYFNATGIHLLQEGLLMETGAELFLYKHAMDMATEAYNARIVELKQHFISAIDYFYAQMLVDGNVRVFVENLKRVYSVRTTDEAFAERMYARARNKIIRDTVSQLSANWG